ncbi:MAG: hypothetical protein V7K53_20180 [Nostoc sp.]|uniref:hypothetical protein n=1 Tax=Nostoc sp. TaxID=1180 RepID=UPI002FF645BA
MFILPPISLRSYRATGVKVLRQVICINCDRKEKLILKAISNLWSEVQGFCRVSVFGFIHPERLQASYRVDAQCQAFTEVYEDITSITMSCSDRIP